MQRRQPILLRCKISKSGFSGERVFHLMQSDETEYVGIAPVEYCFYADKTPFALGQPDSGQKDEGLVQGVLIESIGGTAKVGLPDGEAVQIRDDRIKFKRENRIEYANF